MTQNLNLLQHEILAVLKRSGITISASGSDISGHTAIDKYQIESATLQFGMLVALLNDYDKYSIKTNQQSTFLNKRKLSREQIEITKYDWQDVAMAIDNLEFNGDVKEKTFGNWLEQIDREISLTTKGLISYNTQFYIKQSQKEKYTEQLAISTIRTDKSVRRTNRFQIGTLIATVLIALMACIFQVLSYQLQKKQNLKDQLQLDSNFLRISKSLENLQQNLEFLESKQEVLEKRLLMQTKKKH